MSNALLIAIEGIDGAGTTTQAQLLVNRMNANGIPAHLTNEPSSGPIGRLVRQILTGEVRNIDAAAMALLFAADRMDHVNHEIWPQLREGVHVVTDRYLWSSLAYQSLELDLDWVAAINQRAPAPDLTIYLRVDSQIAGERRRSRGKRPDLYEYDRLQKRIAANYDKLLGASTEESTWMFDSSNLSWRQNHSPQKRTFHPDCSWILQSSIMDGSLPVESLHSNIFSLVNELIANAITESK